MPKLRNLCCLRYVCYRKRRVQAVGSRIRDLPIGMPVPSSHGPSGMQYGGFVNVNMEFRLSDDSNLIRWGL
jgi:hypothetical protein